MTKGLVRQLPPEAAAILDDPRLEGMVYRGGNFPRSVRLLEPEVLPEAGKAPYLIFSSTDDNSRAGAVTWIEEPRVFGRWGRGNGFPDRNAQPRFKQEGRKPRYVPDAWPYAGWLIVSPEFAAVVQRHMTEMETVDIEWQYAVGGVLEGYRFLDITRRLYC
jgi:hypothetical protein